MNNSHDFGGPRSKSVLDDGPDDPPLVWPTHTVETFPELNTRPWIDPDRSSLFWAMTAVAVVVAAIVISIILFSMIDSGDGDRGAGTAAGPTSSIASTVTDSGGSSVPSSTASTFAVAQGADDPNGEAQGSTLTPSTESVAPTLAPTSAPTETETSPTTATTVVVTTTTAAPPETTVEPPSTEPPSTEPAPTEPPSTEPPSTEPPATTEPPSTEPPSTEPPSTDPPAPTGSDAEAQQQVLALTNEERSKAGCPALTLNSQLNAAADGHSEDMAARGYFDHNTPEGTGPGARIDAAGYSGRGWGENIAQGQSTASEVVAGWMNSTGHRENILNCNFNELGVGYAEGSGRGNVPGIYWTQVFGTS